jgi:predicted enzyme related to lactoylglutathione lyase
MGERTHYPPGTFCLVGLAAADPASAASFYTRLFGWDSEERSAGEAGTFTILRRGGRDVAVLYRQTPQARAAGASPHWTSYISVEDADATAARADELGGAAVFRESFDVLDAGRVAAIRDPTGGIVSLWQPRSLIGAAVVNDVGAWCWNELRTTDVERAKAFFGELLSWEYETDRSGYVSIKNAGGLNGGIRGQTESERGTPSEWLPYFTVESVGDLARQAERAGARSLQPTTVTDSARLAVIEDPQGAGFAAFEGETDP